MTLSKKHKKPIKNIKKAKSWSAIPQVVSDPGASWVDANSGHSQSRAHLPCVFGQVYQHGNNHMSPEADPTEQNATVGKCEIHVSYASCIRPQARQLTFWGFSPLEPSRLSPNNKYICNNIQYNLPGTPAGLSLGLDTCKFCQSLLNPRVATWKKNFQPGPISRTNERYFIRKYTKMVCLRDNASEPKATAARLISQTPESRPGATNVQPLVTGPIWGLRIAHQGLVPFILRQMGWTAVPIFAGPLFIHDTSVVLPTYSYSTCCITTS